MEPEGKSANDIVENTRLDHSSWHFFQSKSWLDLAKRTLLSGPLHYAALELRYGIEYLLFELLILTRKGISEDQYQKCLGKPNTMLKMLKDERRSYKKLARFTEIAMSLDPNAPKLKYWDLMELFEFWGISSEFLHFVGAHKRTHDSKEWMIKAISRIEEILNLIWDRSTNTYGIGLFDPEHMTQAVKPIWNEYINDKIDDEAVRIRLNLVKPISAVQKR